jgi:hypothetical protein
MAFGSAKALKISQCGASTIFAGYCLIIGIIQPRRMRWAGHVARMGEKRNAYRLSVMLTNILKTTDPLSIE